MNSPQPDPAIAIASRIRIEREARGWSLGDLAEKSGVSKAMISKIERCDASPTATILGRLSGAFGLQLSMLLALAERTEDRLRRAQAQSIWVDPETGYERKVISPRNGGMLELIQVTLPPRVRIEYPASAFVFQHQQIWVLNGELTFEEGDTTHVLEAGDCLQLGFPTACAFHNKLDTPCVYVIALIRR